VGERHACSLTPDSCTGSVSASPSSSNEPRSASFTQLLDPTAFGRLPAPEPRGDSCWTVPVLERRVCGDEADAAARRRWSLTILARHTRPLPRGLHRPQESDVRSRRLARCQTKARSEASAPSRKHTQTTSSYDRHQNVVERGDSPKRLLHKSRARLRSPSRQESGSSRAASCQARVYIRNPVSQTQAAPQRRAAYTAARVTIEFIQKSRPMPLTSYASCVSPSRSDPRGRC